MNVGNEGGAVSTLDPAASGGAGVASGGAGGAGSEDVAEPDPGPLLGTPTRPQLAAAAAPRFDVLEYLASAGNLATGLVRDNWDPTAGVGDVASFSADFRVAAAGGTHSSVQAAITAAVSAGGTARRFIEVEGGPYREVVCVPSGAPPITLYSTNPDASQTVIVFDNYSGKAKAAGTSANPCNPNLNGTTFGTSGSATFAAFAPEFHAKNLSFVNDTDETTATGGVQGVALMGQGDRQIYENVRVLGNQDSLFIKTPDVATVQRAYFKACFVEGDTDFIFGRATFVLDGCTIRSLTSRTAGGVVLAPSTDSRNPFGILVTRSTFTADATAGASSTSLGRAWDESQVDVPTYTANVQTGVFPNGQAVVRESTLGPHVQTTTPWRAAATTSRAYSSVDGAVPANRFYEFGNAGPGAAPAPTP
jgi:pectinesterase